MTGGTVYTAAVHAHDRAYPRFLRDAPCQAPVNKKEPAARSQCFELPASHIQSCAVNSGAERQRTLVGYSSSSSDLLSRIASSRAIFWRYSCHFQWACRSTSSRHWERPSSRNPYLAAICRTSPTTSPTRSESGRLG